MQFSFRRVPDAGNMRFLLVSGTSTTPTVRTVPRALIVARVWTELLLPPSRLGSADLLAAAKPTGVKQSSQASSLCRDNVPDQPHVQKHPARKGSN